MYVDMRVRCLVFLVKLEYNVLFPIFFVLKVLPFRHEYAYSEILAFILIRVGFRAPLDCR